MMITTNPQVKQFELTYAERHSHLKAVYEACYRVVRAEQIEGPQTREAVRFMEYVNLLFPNVMIIATRHYYAKQHTFNCDCFHNAVLTKNPEYWWR